MANCAREQCANVSVGNSSLFRVQRSQIAQAPRLSESTIMLCGEDLLHTHYFIVTILPTCENRSKITDARMHQ